MKPYIFVIFRGRGGGGGPDSLFPPPLNPHMTMYISGCVGYVSVKVIRGICTHALSTKVSYMGPYSESGDIES